MIAAIIPHEGKLKKQPEKDITCPDGKYPTEVHTPVTMSYVVPISSNSNDGMNSEQNRLDSFRGWTISFIDKKKLALYGFYYVGPDDTVKCYFCKVEIGKWDQGDNVLVEHLRWSSGCPLLRRRITNNIPLNHDLLESSLPPEPSFDDCGTLNYEIRPNAYPEGSAYPTFKLNHPDYSLESDRLNSFTDWPKSIKQKPKELADAGFFYIGKGDQVKCFSCGGGLKDWEEDDVPWEQHALFYDKCPYLELNKGKEYIQHIKNTLGNKQEDITPTLSNDSIGIDIPPSPAIENRKSIIDSSKQCKICFNEDLNTTLFPCMHVVACVKCALSLNDCPICRNKIQDVKRIYFS